MSSHQFSFGTWGLSKTSRRCLYFNAIHLFQKGEMGICRCTSCVCVIEREMTSLLRRCPCNVANLSSFWNQMTLSIVQCRWTLFLVHNYLNGIFLEVKPTGCVSAGWTGDVRCRRQLQLYCCHCSAFHLAHAYCIVKVIVK